MLEYLYCNSVEVDEELAKDLLILAKNYSILGLRSLCEDYLCGCLTPENLVTVANLAEQIESDILREAAVRVIKRNSEELNQREDVLDLPKSILIYCLFKSGHK